MADAVTPAGAGWQAVAAAFDLGDVASVSPVSGGRSHLMWRLRTSRGTWAVKRLNRSHEDWWLRDYAVSAGIQLDAHARGLPVPRPVHPLAPVAPLLADVGGSGYVAHEWHESVPPTDVTAWVGATLASLHTLPATGTPDWHLHPVDEWREWLDEAPGEFTDAVRAHLPDIAEARRLAADTTGLTPVGTHRDVKPDNVLHTAPGPLLVDWDGAGDDYAEAELTRSALYFSHLGEDHEALTAVFDAYASTTAHRPHPSFAGLLRTYLRGAAWMLWRALGHRPVTPPERAAAHTHTLELLADLRTSLSHLPAWTRLLR